MRRLLRILANVGTAVSLLLCVAAAGVWGRSYFVADVLYVAGVAPAASPPVPFHRRPPRAA